MAKEDIIKHQFKKGQSGNPKGRPAGIPNTKTRLIKIMEISQTLKNPITEEIESITVAEQMDIQQIIKALKGDTRAYNAIIDKIESKQDNQSGLGHLPIPILQLSQFSDKEEN